MSILYLRTKVFCGESFVENSSPLLERERKFIWKEWEFNSFSASLQKSDMKDIPLNSS
jgi:hypothetical protein